VRQAEKKYEPKFGFWVHNVLVVMLPTYEKEAYMKTMQKVPNPREIRLKLGMNQQEFWTKVGVTQSGGSRYESGRSMPRPVRELLRLVHVEKIDIDKAKGEDFALVSYLKSANPNLYKNLKKAMRETPGNGKIRRRTAARH
jgi:transcriptional regulator with XRE-family HTH domain